MCISYRNKEITTVEKYGSSKKYFSSFQLYIWNSHCKKNLDIV